MPGVAVAKPAVVVQPSSKSPTANALDFLTSATTKKKNAPPPLPTEEKMASTQPTKPTPAPGEQVASDPLDFLESAAAPSIEPADSALQDRIADLGRNGSESTSKKSRQPAGDGTLQPASPLASTKEVWATKTKKQREDAIKGLASLAVIAAVVMWYTSGFGLLGHGTMSRQEFQQAVSGKTPEQVISILGRPERTMDDGVWTYEGRTRDPVSGKVDTFVHVHFMYYIPGGKGGLAGDCDFLP